MSAKSMTRIFVTTEIIFALTFVALGLLFMHCNGIVGIVQAYVINYMLYMFTMFVLFRNFFYIKNE